MDFGGYHVFSQHFCGGPSSGYLEIFCFQVRVKWKKNLATEDIKEHFNH
jgi:hypothetical protein